MTTWLREEAMSEWVPNHEGTEPGVDPDGRECGHHAWAVYVGHNHRPMREGYTPTRAEAEAAAVAAAVQYLEAELQALREAK